MPIMKFLKYENFYKDFDQIDPRNLIKDISTENIIYIISKLNCILWSRETNMYTQNFLFKGFMNSFETSSNFHINNLMIRNPEYYNYIIFNNISNLLCSNFAIQNFSENSRELDSIDMENIFKLVLYFNQVYNNTIVVDTDIENKDQLSLSLSLGFAQIIFYCLKY